MSRAAVPKTSPSKTNEQLVYGNSMGLIIIGLYVVKIPNAPIIPMKFHITDK